MSKIYKTHYHRCKNCDTYTEYPYRCHNCEKGLIETVEFEIEDNWTSRLHIGNIVKCSVYSSLYMVTKVKEKGVDLIPLNACNVSFHPEIDWPWDPNRRVNKLEIVGDNMKDYINKCFSGMIGMKL